MRQSIDLINTASKAKAPPKNNFSVLRGFSLVKSGSNRKSYFSANPKCSILARCSQKSANAEKEVDDKLGPNYHIIHKPFKIARREQLFRACSTRRTTLVFYTLCMQRCHLI